MQLAKHWRLKGQRYRLEAARNQETGAITFPAPAVPEPGYETIRLSGKGEIWSFAEVRQGADDFGGAYIVAMIRLAEGPMITAQLTDVDPRDVRIGQPVEAVTRRLRALGSEGLLVYGYKFRPVLE